MPAPKNNQNAKKDGAATSHLHIRVTPEFKAQLVKQAQKRGLKLSEHVIDKLAE